jgi:hypothetical protein
MARATGGVSLSSSIQHHSCGEPPGNDWAIRWLVRRSVTMDAVDIRYDKGSLTLAQQASSR